MSVFILFMALVVVLRFLRHDELLLLWTVKREPGQAQNEGKRQNNRDLHA